MERAMARAEWAAEHAAARAEWATARAFQALERVDWDAELSVLFDEDRVYGIWRDEYDVQYVRVLDVKVPGPA